MVKQMNKDVIEGVGSNEGVGRGGVERNNEESSTVNAVSMAAPRGAAEEKTILTHDRS